MGPYSPPPLPTWSSRRSSLPCYGGTPALPSGQSEDRSGEAGSSRVMNPGLDSEGAVVPGWSISVESFRVEFLLSPGRDHGFHLVF